MIHATNPYQQDGRETLATIFYLLECKSFNDYKEKSLIFLYVPKKDFVDIDFLYLLKKIPGLDCKMDPLWELNVHI